MRRLIQWPPVENLPDLIDVRNHAADFRGSRAQHIETRVHVLAMLFAVLVILWIGIDFVSVGSGEFMNLFVARVGLASLFFGIVIWRGRPNSLTQARIRLALLIVFPCMFYIFSRLILNDGASEAAQLGYTFYPFVLIVQLAVFPLTLVEGLILCLPVLLSMGIVEMHFGSLITLTTLGNFWLIVLLLALALWAEMSQLHMLLRLYRQATRDPLTGLFNRRLLLDRLDVEIARAHRYGKNFAILMLDLDLFKRVNDTYGHLTGDRVLRVFADLIRGAIRQSDLAGRYGGEEFLALLPESDAKAAVEVAERIRKACHENQVTSPDGQSVQFSTSIGVALLMGNESGSDLINRADISLYQAKEEGRNRVVLSK